MALRNRGDNMPGIMIQGTASSVGKSLMCAALCRIFSNDGWNAAPFKSQNMSLNSYATSEGLEMGRAQVLQAIAARVEPSVNMNPILLKPTTDRKSQVVIKGKPHVDMDASEYFVFKPKLKEMVTEIYWKIHEKYDFIVIEGAGSPAEINLMENDIVNMGMAVIAKAPVLLVADIDKGGVFASIYGTVMLLSEDDRNRIKGIIINKFRGDKELLKPGIDMIEDLVHIPVIGIVPYMDINLDEEDGACDFNYKDNGCIKISVIKLPRISNFTDFDGFKLEEDVSLNFITKPEKIGDSDMLIIPGSKNTIEDLRWLKKRGFETAVKNFKGIVFGICGGYQIMGKRIIDFEELEVNMGEDEAALGIFETETIFEGEKITVNVKGNALGCKVYGYEIHSGRTFGNTNPFVEIEAKNEKYMDGDIKDNFYGTYLHGIFDSNEFRTMILNKIRNNKKIPEAEGKDLNKFREEELEKLALRVRENIDIEYVYGLLGKKND